MIDTRTGRLVLLLPLLLLLAACGGEPPAATPAGAAPAASERLLAADLPDAVRVLDAKEAEDGATVKVWGRVRQVANGVFTLVDDEDVAYCGQTRPDPCRTPWDYCCENPDQVRAATLVVEVKDAAGKDVPAKAFGVRPLDLVALEGTLAKAEDGTVVLRATGSWFRRERPDLPEFVEFP